MRTLQIRGDRGQAIELGAEGRAGLGQRSARRIQLSRRRIGSVLLDPESMRQQILQCGLYLGIGMQRAIGFGAHFLRQDSQHLAQALHAQAAFLQMRFECVGTVEQVANCALAAAPAQFAPPGKHDNHCRRERGANQIGHGASTSRRSLSLPYAQGLVKCRIRRRPGLLIDFVRRRTYHRAPMNAALPETVDAWRMVQARRLFQGSLRLATMSRLRGSLAATDGVVTFDLEFGRDDLGVPFLHARADAQLPLTCQRTLETFALPVHIDTRLGLITQEADEAALPTGYEPLLTGDGALRLADVIEDELILALPVVPVKPGAVPPVHAWTDSEEPQAAAQPNPFAVLQKIKASRN